MRFLGVVAAGVTTGLLNREDDTATQCLLPPALHLLLRHQPILNLEPHNALDVAIGVVPVLRVDFPEELEEEVGGDCGGGGGDGGGGGGGGG